MTTSNHRHQRIVNLLNSTTTPFAEIARQTGVSRMTIYRLRIGHLVGEVHMRALEGYFGITANEGSDTPATQ